MKPPFPRKPGVAVAAAVAIAAWLGFGAYYLITAPEVIRDTLFGGPSQPGLAGIGGPFKLTDQNGQRRSDSVYRGQFMLIYFGYTTCPDVCLATLFAMTEALDLLGEAGNLVRPIFITVDPARDDVATMKAYVDYISPRLIGLTGSAQAIAEVAKAYRIDYAKAEVEGADPASYLVDHSSLVYLMGVDGRYLTDFSDGTTAGQMAARIKDYL